MGTFAPIIYYIIIIIGAFVPVLNPVITRDFEIWDKMEIILQKRKEGRDGVRHE